MDVTTHEYILKFLKILDGGVRGGVGLVPSCSREEVLGRWDRKEVPIHQDHNFAGIDKFHHDGEEIPRMSLLASIQVGMPS